MGRLARVVAVMNTSRVSPDNRQGACAVRARGLRAARNGLARSAQRACAQRATGLCAPRKGLARAAQRAYSVRLTGLLGPTNGA